MSDTLDRLAAVIRDTFNAPNAPIARETTSADIPGWDSLSHTVMIFAVEERFGIELDAEQDFPNVGALADEIDKRLA